MQSCDSRCKVAISLRERMLPQGFSLRLQIESDAPRIKTIKSFEDGRREEYWLIYRNIWILKTQKQFYYKIAEKIQEDIFSSCDTTLCDHILACILHSRCCSVVSALRCTNLRKWQHFSHLLCFKANFFENGFKWPDCFRRTCVSKAHNIWWNHGKIQIRFFGWELMIWNNFLKMGLFWSISLRKQCMSARDSTSERVFGLNPIIEAGSCSYWCSKWES